MKKLKIKKLKIKNRDINTLSTIVNKQGRFLYGKRFFFV